MNPTLKKKLLSIGTSLLSLAAIITVCFTAASIGKKYTTSYIFVSGGSMNPTLMGGHDDSAHAPYYNSATGEYVHGDTVHFGLVDVTKKVKQNIKRYDIVTTYFPEDYDSKGKLKSNADYKIKRVIALPGETFKIEQGNLYVKQNNKYTFIERKHLIDDSGNSSIKDVSERTLGKNEYWLMGDHRSGSKDSVTLNKPITFDQISGVLLSIEGTAEYYVHYVCADCGHEIDERKYVMHQIASCDKCGGSIKKGKGDIRDRHYTYPEII